jgi:hypothetical protein
VNDLFIIMMIKIKRSRESLSYYKIWWCIVYNNTSSKTSNYLNNEILRLKSGL